MLGSLSQISESCAESDESAFYKENWSYLISGPSQISLKVVNLLEQSKLLASIRPWHQTGRILIKVLHEVALSEVESVCWLILIEKSLVYENHADLYHYLLFTAIRTKDILGCKISFIIKKFCKQNKNFEVNYNEWLETNLFLEVNIKEINKKFSHLNKIKSIEVNYNYYVDSILESSNGYKIIKGSGNRNRQKILEQLPGLNCVSSQYQSNIDDVYWDYEVGKTDFGFLLNTEDIYLFY